MNRNEAVSLKQLSNIMIVGGIVALGLVGFVWAILHIFVL